LAVESFSPPEYEPPHRPPKASRRSQVVHERLQREIMLGILRPGATLLELELAQRFGCSQGTVREALLLLQEEGLVVRVQHRGTRVSEATRDDALALLQLRRDIETRAVARALRAYDAPLRNRLVAELDAMRGAARAGDEYLLSLHDRAFHLCLHQAAQLPSVQPILQRCLLHNHRYKILTMTAPRDLLDTANRHTAIIEALDSGDAAKAADALSHHIATIVDLGPRLDSTVQADQGTSR